MTDITAGIDVPAPPAVVWEVLTDVDSYARWNTLLSVEGEFAVGNTVSARLSMPGLPTVRLRPEITAVEPGRTVRWRSSLFGVEAEHAFLVEPVSDGTTRFVQTESFDGPVAEFVVGRLERRIRRGFEQMNVGLRRRAVELRGGGHADR
jgi:hypothetical protein